jgi:hypothetical protein
MDKQSLLELLADNQLSELFNALKDKQGYYKDLILLESQWNDLRTKQRNDLISNEDANIELGQIRNSLHQLIELSDGQPVSADSLTPGKSVTNRTWMLVLAAVAGLIILFEIYRFATASDAVDNAKADNGGAPATLAAPDNKAASKPLNVSEVRPVTIDAGDSYYERVYSLVKTSVESTGGGKSLITLTVGLNFKGSTNAVLGTEKFRLTADELPGPLAPANFIGIVVSAKSYIEGDIKFELSDQIKRFSVVIEGKEDKRWNFSR